MTKETNDTTGSMLKQKVDILENIDPRYFIYSTNYCEEVDCDKEYCDEHRGGVLEIEHQMGSDGDRLGTKIKVALNGPTIYLNTRYGIIEGFFGRAKYSINYEKSDIVHDFYEEIYNNAILNKSEEICKGKSDKLME